MVVGPRAWATTSARLISDVPLFCYSFVTHVTLTVERVLSNVSFGAAARRVLSAYLFDIESDMYKTPLAAHVTIPRLASRVFWVLK